MPELPEVETVRRGLAVVLEGKRIASLRLHRADLRRPFPTDLITRLEGKRVERMDRRAKYMLLHIEGGWVVLLHLGMSGRMLVGGHNGPPPGKHDHLVIETESGNRVTFNDARRFGLVDLVEESALATHKLLRDLGPEPLEAAFTAKVLSGELVGRNTTIKAALMDQHTVAGLGNIYVCEALFRSGISPKRKASTVAGARAEKLVPAIKSVLAEAIKAGGSTLRDHRHPSGELGYFQHSFKVYGREGERCPGCDCNSSIKRIVQNGRSTFFCAKKQR